MQKRDLSNCIIVAILIFAIAIIVINVLLKNIEWFSQAEDIFNILTQLSLAYISGLIFYLIVIYLPEKKKKNRYRTIGYSQITGALKRHIL